MSPETKLSTPPDPGPEKLSGELTVEQLDKVDGGGVKTPTPPSPIPIPIPYPNQA